LHATCNGCISGPGICGSLGKHHRQRPINSTRYNFPPNWHIVCSLVRVNSFEKEEEK
jgi:hypothetical protein